MAPSPRELIVSTHLWHGAQIGYDLAWRVTAPDGARLDIWWGNTRDAAGLRGTIADARQRGYVFTLGASAEALLAGHLGAVPVRDHTAGRLPHIEDAPPLL